GAFACCAYGDFARMLFGILGQVGQRLDVAFLRVHGKAVRVIDQIADQVELRPVVLCLAFDRNGQQVGCVDEPDRIAVGLGASHFGKADFAAGAWSIHDDNAGIIAQVFFNIGCQSSSNQVCASARTVGNDHADRVLG